jgi:hypothetical protein
LVVKIFLKVMKNLGHINQNQKFNPPSTPQKWKLSDALRPENSDVYISADPSILEKNRGAGWILFEGESSPDCHRCDRTLFVSEPSLRTTNQPDVIAPNSVQVI